MASRPPAVLLGGERIALSAGRSLAAMGVEVHALGHHRDPIRWSRSRAQYVVTANRDGRGADPLLWLEESAPAGAVVLPCSDEGVELVARHRQRLVERGLRPIEGDDEVMLAMLDKERTYELSRAAGVPTPRTALPRSMDEASAIAADFPYPCALKPVASHRFAAQFGVNQKVFIVHDAGELVENFAEAQRRGLDMLVTEIIPGPDTAFCSFYSYLDQRGEPLFRLTKRKLRGWPIGFGLTTYHMTDWVPEVAELGLRFFQGVGLRGVGNVEFKRDPRDGLYKIIECNHRFTAANELVRYAGVDIPRLAYERAAGLPVTPIRGYRSGARMWHPIEDTRALVEYRREGTLTTRRWLRSLMHRQHFPVLRSDDPLPTLATLGLRAGTFARKLALRTVGRGRPPS